MPYIGHNPTNAGSFIELDDFGSSFDGSETQFTLQVGSVDITPNAQNLLIMIDGVVQQPTNAYSVSGSTITFTEAPPSGADFYGVLMGQSASVGQGTVGADELKVTGNGSSGQVLSSDGDGTFSWVTDSEEYLPLAGGTLTGSVTGMTGLTGGTGDFNWDSNTLVVDSSESRVGIGIASPDEILHLYKTGGSAYMEIESGDANPARIILTNTEGGAVIDANNGLLRLGVNTGDMVMDASGNVGIGDTSTGTYKLVVDSGTAGNSNAEAGIFVDGTRSGVVFNLVSNSANTSVGTGTGIKFKSGGFTTGAIITRSTGTAASGDAPGYMTFHTSTDDSEDLAERMRISSSGNVGIGTTSPNYASLAKTLTIYDASGNVGLELARGASDAPTFYMATESADDIIIANRHNGYMRFLTNNTLALTLDSSQNATFGGNVTKPNQPYFYVRAGGEFDSGADVVWSVVVEDEGMNYSTSTGIATIPVTGIYAVNWTCKGQSSGDVCYAQLQRKPLSGSFAMYGTALEFHNDITSAHTSACFIGKFTVGDQVKITNAYKIKVDTADAWCMYLLG